MSPCISGSSEKNARLGGLASVKGRRYLFSLKIKPLTLFLAYNRAEQVDYLGSRTESIISSVGKIYLLRGTSCTLWWRHMERTRPSWSPLFHNPPTSTSQHKSFKAVSTQRLYSKPLAEPQTTFCFEDVAYHDNMLESLDSSFNISYRDAVEW